MPSMLFAVLWQTLQVIRPAFGEQAFANLLVVLAGWVRTHGRHAITEALVATGVAG